MPASISPISTCSRFALKPSTTASVCRCVLRHQCTRVTLTANVQRCALSAISPRFILGLRTVRKLLEARPTFLPDATVTCSLRSTSVGPRVTRLQPSSLVCDSSPRLCASAARGHRAFGCIRTMTPLLGLPQTARHAVSRVNGLGPTRRTLSSLFWRADIAGWLQLHEAAYVVAPLKSRAHPLPADLRLHAGMSAYDQPVLRQSPLPV